MYQYNNTTTTFSVPSSCCLDPQGGKVLFTKGAESAILPFTTSGEIEKTRLHVDEFALVSNNCLSDFFCYFKCTQQFFPTTFIIVMLHFRIWVLCRFFKLSNITTWTLPTSVVITFSLFTLCSH